MVSGPEALLLFVCLIAFFISSPVSLDQVRRWRFCLRFLLFGGRRASLMALLSAFLYSLWVLVARTSIFCGVILFVVMYLIAASSV